jgi:hypothetical protein
MKERLLKAIKKDLEERNSLKSMKDRLTALTLEIQELRAKIQQAEKPSERFYSEVDAIYHELLDETKGR